MPKFLADAALGRLATWLRLLGTDAVYDSTRCETALIRRARAEQRILLTRNRRLLRRRSLPPHLYVQSDDFRAQLRQVVEAFDLNPRAHALSRCSRCNTLLTPIDKSSLRGEVPEYVFETQSAFARCAECGRIYWRATHVERITSELRALTHSTRGSGKTPKSSW